MGSGARCGGLCLIAAYIPLLIDVEDDKVKNTNVQWSLLCCHFTSA